MYFKQAKSPVPEEVQEHKVLSDTEALQIYFRIHNDIKSKDFDGGAANIATRDFVLTFDTLWSKAVAEQPEKAFKTLNYIAYNDVPLLGDLKSEWDIRIHGKV